MGDFETGAKPAAAPSWGSDILKGAGAGAVLGTAAVPGLGTVMGGITGGLAGAAGHLFRGMFDDAPAPAVKPPAAASDPAAPEASSAPATAPAPQAAATDAQKDAAKDLHKRQGSTDSNSSPDKKFDPKEKIGDLAKMTPEERLAAVNKMTQNDPNNQNAGDYCGPTALLAAAMAKGGNAGVQALIDKMKKDDLTQHPSSTSLGSDKDGNPRMETTAAGSADKQAALTALQAKLADPKSGGMTQGDLKMLQQNLYQDLQMQQNALGDSAAGIGNKTLSNFINATPEVAKLFFDKDGKQNMSLNNIDNTGDGKAAHWVVNMNTEKGGAAVPGQDGNSYNTVYDPWKRGGGQVTTNAQNPKQLGDYMNTYSDNRRVEVKPPPA